MQQDVNTDPNALPAAPAPAVEPVAAPLQEPAIDREYVANLQRAYAAQQAELNRYGAVKDDIDWMLGDETRLNSVRKYRTAYEEASKPEIHPDLLPLLEEVRKENAPLKAYVTREEANRERAEAATRQTFINDNIAFAQRLVGEKKITPAQVDELAAIADARAHRLGRNVTIEEAYKSVTGFSGSQKTEAASAPVLRGDAGEIGVPGPSQTDNKRWTTDFHGALVDEIKKAQRTA